MAPCGQSGYKGGGQQTTQSCRSLARTGRLKVALRSAPLAVVNWQRRCLWTQRMTRYARKSPSPGLASLRLDNMRTHEEVAWFSENEPAVLEPFP